MYMYIPAQDPGWYPSLASRQVDSQETQEYGEGRGGGEGEGEVRRGGEGEGEARGDRGGGGRGRGEGEGGSQGINRQLSTESSSPDAVCPPPQKRKRSVSMYVSLPFH